MGGPELFEPRQPVGSEAISNLFCQPDPRPYGHKIDIKIFLLFYTIQIKIPHIAAYHIYLLVNFLADLRYNFKYTFMLGMNILHCFRLFGSAKSYKCEIIFFTKDITLSAAVIGQIPVPTLE